MSYAPPPPPVADGVLVADRYAMLGDLARGRYGACCMCNGTCYTWWSDRAPSGYVPLHEGCVPRLVEHWTKFVADGGAEPERTFVPPSGRRGAYARRAATVDTAPASAPQQPARVVTAGAVLPDRFIPGPFWLPGDDHLTPWTGLLETATGHTVCPAGANVAHAEKTYAFYRSQRIVSYNTPVVGGALIAPDGSVTRSWGSVPVVGSPRWVSVSIRSEWGMCPGCGELKWPGSWRTDRNVCMGCQSAREVADPREWPYETPHPGQQAVPDTFITTKKVTPPASARLAPSLNRGRLTSRRKSG
jgi:hypothetical protein